MAENPEDPQEDPYPSIFSTPEAQLLRDRHEARDYVFHQCRTGLPHRKPTQLLTTVEIPMGSPLRAFCNHGEFAHAAIEGKIDGEWATAAQSCYPRKLCRELAKVIVAGIEQLPPHSSRDLPVVDRRGASDDPQGLWAPLKAPSIGQNWSVLTRWTELFRTRWKVAEHNNVGELRMAVAALRHLSRSRRHWDSRVMLIGDSLVAIGVLAKGRSSSPPLLRLARQAASVQLILGVRLYLRWVESKRNLADGPSRGHPIGIAPE